MNKIKDFKKDFPIFQRRINGQKLIYLDSAATAQKPKVVIDAVVDVYKKHNANIHRGIYTISEEATKLFEQTREKVAKFINAKDAKEIIFTHNTTEALNLVAYGLGQKLKKGDAILISEMEHHSNIVPWQRVAKEKGARLLFWAIGNNGVLTNRIVDHLNTVQYLSVSEIPNLKIVSITHVSNVLGTINPIEEIIKEIRAKSSEVRVIVDAAQSVPHMPVDVKKLDCDFLAFSGHKMLAPTGVGVLWGRKELLEKMEPLLTGSHMIREVTKKSSTWNDVPWRFEPGTAAIEAVVGLSAAIDYLNKIGMDKIRSHERKLMAYSLSRMEKINGLILYGSKNIEHHGGVISFNIKGVHAHDVAQILNEDNICVRSGHHCAMPLHQRLGVPATARVSFYLYNDKNDVDKFIEGIEKVKRIFGAKV